MSQDDVHDFLKEQRKLDENKWFRVKDIQDALREKGLSEGVLKGVSNDLYMLMRFGDIEWRGVGIWKHYKEFRALPKEKQKKV